MNFLLNILFFSAAVFIVANVLPTIKIKNYWTAVEGGRWKVEGGRWKVEGGRWKVEGGRWKVEGGRWEVEGGRWALL